MKKGLKTLLALMMLVSVSACSKSTSTQETSVANVTDGTYVGTSVGMQGDLSVELVVEGGKITTATVTQTSETPSIARVALERLPQQIVEHQTTDLDTVTGATLASNAIMRAAKDAALQAGFTEEQLSANAYHATAGEDETLDADVAVVGGGGAGLSAAISAAQQGSNVILIEKSSFLGGNTMMAGGAFNCVDPQAQEEAILSTAQLATLNDYLALDVNDEALHFADFPEWEHVLTDLQADIQAYLSKNAGKQAGVDMPGYDSIALHMWHIYTGGLRQLNDGTWICPNHDLAQTLAESALDAYDWAGSLGVEISHEGSSLYTVLGAMWPRTHAYTAGEPLIDALRNKAEELGVQIYTETAGKELIVDDSNKVVGVKAEKADGTQVTINTNNGVILASGGYCANPKMVKEYDNYWGDDLSDHTLTTNVGTNDGDGIVMGMAISASTTDLGVSQMMPSSSPIKGTMTDGVWADASEQVWFDGNGKRFVDEYAERDVLAKASLELEDGIFYILYAGGGDEDGLCKGADPTMKMFGTSLQTMIDNGHVWYGSTLAELAEATKQSAGGSKATFTEEQLRTLIETYNSYVDNQEDPEFGKEVLAGKIDIDAIEADSSKGFVISPRKSSLHHTMGGLTINTDAQVLDTEGNAIEGLWAAGEVTGGVHGGNRLGGNAIADIFTFGRIAGENAGK